MYLRDKLSLHEISRRTGLSRNTLRKWVRVPEESVAPPLYQREQKPTRLSPYHAVLEQALKADAHRIKQNRRSAKALFAQITTSGYAGSYSRVTDFIRDWRGTEGKAPHAFVPLSFELGEAFQFDWSEEGLVIGGIYRRIQVSHLKLCASRAFWLVAYPSQGHEMLFDAHTRSFAALGGVSRRGIYDNMKTAVDKVTRAGGASSMRALSRCVRTTCSTLTSAIAPRVGKKAWSRRTYRTAAAGSGSMRRVANSARLRNSMPGSASAARRYGVNCVTRNIQP
jgi:transposase